MRYFKNYSLAQMSDGHYCVVRDLGLVKGGKGMKHHDVLIDLSLRGALQLLKRILKVSDKAQHQANTYDDYRDKEFAHRDSKLRTAFWDFCNTICQLLPLQTCIPARLQPPRPTPKSCSLKNWTVTGF